MYYDYNIYIYIYILVAYILVINVCRLLYEFALYNIYNG